MSKRKLLSPVYSSEKNRDHETIGCHEINNTSKNG